MPASPSLRREGRGCHSVGAQLVARSDRKAATLPIHAGHPSGDHPQVAAFASERVAAFTPERWPASRRNPWPASPGIRIPPLPALAELSQAGDQDGDPPKNDSRFRQPRPRPGLLEGLSGVEAGMALGSGSFAARRFARTGGCLHWGRAVVFSRNTHSVTVWSVFRPRSKDISETWRAESKTSPCKNHGEDLNRSDLTASNNL